MTIDGQKIYTDVTRRFFRWFTNRARSNIGEFEDFRTFDVYQYIDTREKYSLGKKLKYKKQIQLQLSGQVDDLVGAFKVMLK